MKSMLNVSRTDFAKTAHVARAFEPSILFATLTPQALAKGEALAAS